MRLYDAPLHVHILYIVTPFSYPEPFLRAVRRGALAGGPGQGRIQDFSYVSQSFRMYNIVLRAANARGT